MGNETSKEKREAEIRREHEEEMGRIRQRQEREQRQLNEAHELEQKKINNKENELKALQSMQQAEWKTKEKQYKAELRRQEQHYEIQLQELQCEIKQFEDERQAILDRKLKQPWREFEPGGEWSVAYQDRLIEEIKQQQLYGTQLKNARLLFLGPIRSGKSSFINSVATIDHGRISAPLLAGASDTSMTRKLKEYSPTRFLQNFRLLDTMGVEDKEGEGFNVKDVIYVIRGNVKRDYYFNNRKPIDESDTKNFNKNPGLEDVTHCVVIVMDSSVVYSDAVPAESKKKIKDLQQYIIDNDIPTVLLLTKIDELCEEVCDDITITYQSRKVRDAVKKVADLFGVTEMNIFPVRNYSNQTYLKHEMNILILLALRRMMQLANDRLESMEQQKNPSNYYCNIE